ncbi:GHKL domain-containing protein [Candidatus Peregrinibacteria bacterium]|nr:GHKL domain-containing protein [Candidatus Peregrinibacteria bacterium]
MVLIPKKQGNGETNNFDLNRKIEECNQEILQILEALSQFEQNEAIKHLKTLKKITHHINKHIFSILPKICFPKGLNANTVTHSLSNEIGPIPMLLEVFSFELQDKNYDPDNISDLTKMVQRYANAKKTISEIKNSPNKTETIVDEETLKYLFSEIPRDLIPPFLKLNLGVSPQSIKLNISPLNFKLLINELLMNAIKAMTTEQRHWLELNLYATDKFCVIRCSNSGRKIPKESLPKVFDSGFFERDETSPNSRCNLKTQEIPAINDTHPRLISCSSGEGLALIKETIEQLEGQVQIQSTNNGTIVTIFIPTTKQSG